MSEDQPQSRFLVCMILLLLTVIFSWGAVALFTDYKACCDHDCKAVKRE
jgi:hypothetical protein